MNEIKWKDHAGSKPPCARESQMKTLMMKQKPDVGLQKLVLKITMNNIAQTTKIWWKHVVYYLNKVNIKSKHKKVLKNPYLVCRVTDTEKSN
jgi:hypothetical protein